MSFNEHGNIELAPTTIKETGAFVVFSAPAFTISICNI